MSKTGYLLFCIIFIIRFLDIYFLLYNLKYNTKDEGDKYVQTLILLINLPVKALGIISLSFTYEELRRFLGQENATAASFGSETR